MSAQGTYTAMAAQLQWLGACKERVMVNWVDRQLVWKHLLVISPDMDPGNHRQEKATQVAPPPQTCVTQPSPTPHMCRTCSTSVSRFGLTLK
jgi:hypothetical protein